MNSEQKESRSGGWMIEERCFKEGERVIKCCHRAIGKNGRRPEMRIKDNNFQLSRKSAVAWLARPWHAGKRKWETLASCPWKAATKPSPNIPFC